MIRLTLFLRFVSYPAQGTLPESTHALPVYESGTRFVRDHRKHPLFSIVFRNVLLDHALFHSLLFAGTLTLVARRPGESPVNAMMHKGEAIRLLNQKLQNLETATDDGSIGAILTLTGVDVSKHLVFSIPLQLIGSLGLNGKPSGTRSAHERTGSGNQDTKTFKPTASYTRTWHFLVCEATCIHPSIRPSEFTKPRLSSTCRTD
jgi:hypothetical protein